MDGSFHAWYEQRGPHGCLMNMVDDATSLTHARMGKAETIWSAVHVLRAWIARYGIPLALYTDWKNVYKVAPTPQQELRGEEPLTQFGRMCARLGIRIVGAHSPQAKGRVERKNGVHQDRLVKKMRRLGIDNYAAANAYLQAIYLPALNQRFAQNAARPEDYHRAKPSAAELDDVFRMETERSVSNDWVVRYDNRYLQLLPPRRAAREGSGIRRRRRLAAGALSRRTPGLGRNSRSAKGSTASRVHGPRALFPATLQAQPGTSLPTDERNPAEVHPWSPVARSARRAPRCERLRYTRRRTNRGPGLRSSAPTDLERKTRKGTFLSS
jgi:hypothetical protein